MANDIISQAMGILGGTKKEAKDAAAPQKQLLPRPLKEAVAMTSLAPVAQPLAPLSRLSKAERIVVKELARYAALHAAIIEMRHDAENGGNLNMIEQRLEDTLKGAKVVIK